MTTIVAIQAIGLILGGLLAGEELIVRYGVQSALNALDDRTHVRARVAIVHRLKVVVPVLMVPTFMAAALSTIGSYGTEGAGWRWAGMIALVVFVLIAFLGTVPINIKVNDWQVDDPPEHWKAVLHRWETIDVFRSSAAILSFILSFILFTVALAVQA